MTALPQPLFTDVIEALTSAERPDLVARMKDLSTEELTSKQAAKLLGVASVNTVKNWLKGGFFPGAYCTLGGHWRFPRLEVLATKRRMEALRSKNRSGDLAPPEGEEQEIELPLL